MSDKQAESLSALMDNEINELEMHRLLKDTENPELRARWSRYNMARAAIRNDISAFSHIDISVAVSEAIDQERPSGKAKPWVRAIGSFAVAASVTLAVLVGVRVYNTQIAEPDSSMAANESVPVQGVELPAYTLQQGQTYASFSDKPRVNNIQRNQQVVRVAPQVSPYAQQRLNDFMLRHVEQVTLNANLGVIPYARVKELQEVAK